MKLYLIGGKADSGKNFFGDILKKKFEEEGKKVCMLRITAPLYNYAKEYFNWDGEEKTKPRELLQTLGIEVIREMCIRDRNKTSSKQKKAFFT